MGAVAGQGVGPPEALHFRGGETMLAGLVAADGALRFHAGVRMDEDVSLTRKIIVQDLFQLFDFIMAGLQGEVPGQDEMEVDKDAGAGPAGPELVDVNPHMPAVIGDDPADFFQKLGVGFVHETGGRLVDQPGPGDEDIEAHQDGDGAVQPVPAGEINAHQAQDDSHGGVDVGEDVLAVGDEDDGFGAAAHHHQDHAQDEVHQGGAQDEEQCPFPAWGWPGGGRGGARPRRRSPGPPGQ